MHVCAHYTPLAKPDIPMEGLTKKSMGTKRAESCNLTATSHTSKTETLCAAQCTQTETSPSALCIHSEP